MHVKNHLLEKSKLTTVSLDENLGSVLKKISAGNFLSLPVIEGEEFKGVIMKEAIYRKYFDGDYSDKEDFLENTTVESVYDGKFEFIRAGDNIEKAAYLLRELSTPFLPVFNQGDEFVGILTHVAIFNAFSEVFGLDKGVRLVVHMFDIPGQLARLTNVVKREEINIINLSLVDAKILDIIKVILRVETDDVDGLVEKIELAGFKIGEINGV